MSNPAPAPDPNAALINLAIFAVEEAIKYSPALIAEFRSLLNKDNPGPEDWAALRAKVLGDTYEALVPNSRLKSSPK